MRKLSLAFFVLPIACGGSPARVSEPVAAVPAPPNGAPPALAVIEQVRVERGSAVAIAGVMHTFSAFSADGVVDAVGFVGLTDPSGATLQAPTHGCIRTQSASVRVESVTLGPPVVAELAVAPGEGAERVVPWMQTVDLAIGDRLVSVDGFLLQVHTIRERLGALIWDLEARAAEGRAEMIAASQGGTAFGGDRLVSVESADRRDALGCAIARVTLERPSLVLTAEEGAEIRIRRGSRARLGALTVEYVGLGERRTTRGDVALVSLSITLGARTEAHTVHFDETLELEGYAIDVIDAGPYARVRLRAR